MGVGKDQIMMYFKNKTGVSPISKITEGNRDQYIESREAIIGKI